jgi:tetratricopeptide (TPR) repeat protein
MKFIPLIVTSFFISSLYAQNDSLLDIAVNHLNEGNSAKAMVIIDSLLKSNPKHENALYWKASSYEYDENWSQAINVYTFLISFSNQKADYINQRMHTYMNSKQYENAITDGETLLELNEYIDNALHSIAFSYMLNKNYTKSIEFFDKAIKRKPNLKYLYCNATYTLRKLNQIDKACEYYKKATTGGKKCGFSDIEGICNKN